VNRHEREFCRAERVSIAKLFEVLRGNLKSKISFVKNPRQNFSTGAKKNAPPQRGKLKCEEAALPPTSHLFRQNKCEPPQAASNNVRQINS